VANGWGGKRAGSGRKPTAEQFPTEIAAAKRRIADALPQLIENMLTLANGVTVQTVDEETGGIEIYTKPPDRKANEYLIDRILGRPTQAVEIDPDPDGALEVTAEAMAQAASELALWRTSMAEQLSSLSAPPTPPTPATTTE
jgi:hypothetical protein